MEKKSASEKIRDLLDIKNRFSSKEGRKLALEGKLPENSYICGDLDLYMTMPKKPLPSGLHVGGFLRLQSTELTSLPSGLRVDGDMDLQRSAITSLPDGLYIGGNLSLVVTRVTSLPKNLYVGGEMYIDEDRMTSLPSGLRVGGVLDLKRTKIKLLPKDLVVGGDVLSSVEFSGEKPTGVKGKVVVEQ